MMRRVAAGLLLFVATTLHADWLAVGADIDILGFTVTSSGWVDYQCMCLFGSGSFSGSHSIQDGGVGTVS